MALDTDPDRYLIALYGLRPTEADITLNLGKT